MKALIFFSKKETRDVVSFLCESKYSFDVVETETVDATLALLPKESRPFDCIICDLNDDGREIMRHVFTTGSPIHFICSTQEAKDLSASQKLKNWVHFLIYGSMMRDLEKTISRLFKDAGKHDLPDSQRFVKIKLSLLLAANPLPGDLYIKATEESAPTKVLPAGKPFAEKEYQYFSEKRGLKNLWVRADEIPKFLGPLDEKLLPPAVEKAVPVAQSDESAWVTEKDEDVRPQDPQLTESFEKVVQMSAKLGFTQEVKDFTQASVMKTITDVKKAPKLSKLLRNLNRDKDKYLSNHSMLLAHVSCALAMHMDWKSDTTYHKLTLASFLHDIVLINHELAAVETLPELEQKAGQFTEKEIQDYKTHPSVGAKLAQGFSEVPPDVDLIISQHHEKPDGTGFPRGLGHMRISPLAAVFIVAHDLVKYILESGEGQNLDKLSLKDFITKRAGIYKSGNFKKALAAVQKVSL